MNVRCDEHSVPKPPVTHHGSVKKYIKKGCLKCSERDGALVCSNDDCPIVIHKDCMRCAAYFDGEGNFYCPYCAYNRSLDKYRKAKECAVLAKKALSSFMNAKAAGSTEDEQIVGNSKRERSDVIDSMVRKDQQPVEASINLGDVNANYVSVNSEKAGLKEHGSNHGFVTHTEAVNMGLKIQQNRSPMDRSYDGLAEKVQKQSVAREPTKVMNYEARDVNCSVREVENIPVGHKASKAVLKNDANSASKENTGLYYGEMDTGDERKSSEETCRQTGCSIRRKRKIQVSAHSEIGTHPRKSAKSIHDDSTVNAVRVTVNSENAGFKQQESMTGAEAVNMGTENQQNQQNKNAMNETDVGVSANVCRQSEAQEPTNNAVKEEAKLLKSDVNYLIKEKSGVLYEELDNTGDERKSSQESHPTGYQLRHNRKTSKSGTPQISTSKESVSFGDSDSDFEKDARMKRKPKVELDTPTQINDQLPPVPQSRRDRLRWTVEEEEMLKEAVNTFSLVAKKNMPWARVLQYGSHIFDGTRTPDDLRCKWKGIVRKANKNNGQ